MSAANLNFIESKLDKEKAYWAQKLVGDLVVTGLPLDFRRPEHYGGEKRAVEFAVEAATAERLRAMCGGNELLIFTALVTALKICLHKYTGHEDIVIGTAVHGQHRGLASLNQLLALRDAVGPAATAKQLLLDVKRTLSEAYAHQKYPFGKVVEASGAAPANNRAPLFDVVALLSNVNEREHVRHLKNDLTLHFSVNAGDIHCAVEYNPHLFLKETAELFGKHFGVVLRAVADSPEIEIARIELLSPAGRQRLVADFNRTASPYPHDKTIHKLFEEQAEQTPAGVAVIDGARRLTYGELDRRANQLARRLRSLGVGPGARVGIYLEHSLETLVGLVGVLKAGAAYVPLDTDHPPTRLAFAFQDARIGVVLTQQALAERLPSADSLSVVSLDSAWDDIAAESAEPLAGGATPEDLAYVIYTSGSTGQPKGVKIQHRSLVNYIWWAKRVYLGGARLAFPLYSSLAFDLTVTSIYTPLVTGNSVVVYRPDGWESPIFQILRENRVGVLKLTPSHLSLIKDRDNSGCHIERLVVGGEALEVELARQVQQSFGREVEIINEYGPTEATVGCMIHRFDPERDTRAFVPVGTPAANTEIYVLDEQLNPVAENILGELYVAGDGLAEGYLDRENLTAERFVAHPFRPGRRMYRTGDLARALPNGGIEYVGRRDEQVKFHGYRVELNEIRSALNRLPEVRDSVVVMRKDRHGNDMMVAYYVARQEIDAERLRAHMAESIIRETIPNVFVHMRKLPLTLNGKINLQALPDVEEAREKMKRKFVAPQTPVEVALAGIWAEVLGVKQVGAEDSFFGLGGHSLLATQVISRVREAFRVEVQLRSLFEEPTVKGLAKRVTAQIQAGHIAEAPPITRAPRDAALPLSFAQQRLWFIDQLEPGGTSYNVPTAVRLSGRLDVSALERTLSEVVRRHEVLRTTFAEADGRPAQVVGEARPLRLNIIDLSEVADGDREARAQELLAEEARTPFDLARGPLLRAGLIKLSEEEHVALLTMHHIVADGWSVGLLIGEVAALYEAFSAGQSSPLAELPLQYADFAAWQRGWLRGAALDEQLAYWRGRLAGAPEVLGLPTDRARPAARTHGGGHEAVALTEGLSERLRALSRREGVTLFMTLLAAWQALLHRYTGQEDIVVGSPVAGRNRAETEALIGFFVNTLVLRTDLSGDPAFRELLGRVREVCLGAYAHQDVPFEKLVEELRPERSLSHAPLFQVMFALQNAPEGELRLGGLRLSAAGARNADAKFDLTLALQDSGGRIEGALEYDSELFEPSTVRRMLRHFVQLLEGATSAPARRLSALPILGEDERQRILVEWNNTAREFPACASIHELFERQAEKTPDATAVVCGDEQISYAELNDRANRLAHYLLKRGVGAEVPVGLCVERSIEMVVGMLGILKAGGTYVPFDAQYPPERIAYMLEDARITVLVTQEHLADSLSSHAVPAVCLDADWDKVIRESASKPVVAVSGDNLAYVIYTSGSTGRPKGVAVTHRAVNRLVINTDYVQLTPADVVAQASNSSFDAATFEIWGALLNGARLVVVDKRTALSPPDFAAQIEAAGINTIFITTALFNQMAREAPAAFRNVRHLLVGGEQVDPRRVADVLRAGPPERLLNVYGPTETTTFATWLVVRQVAEGATNIPIGRPIANTEAYVLDRNLRPVPVGVAGEIYIGGDGLARGYLREPVSSAERFVPHPFAAAPGMRLYKTGDLARFNEDGSVEFLARLDHQVKVRGFRIELGEIEAALGQHASVGDAAVLARDDDAGGKRLVAYVVADLPPSQLAGELRAFLQPRLPDYMIPSAFVALDSLPLTPNGKVDRRALPAPEQLRPEPAEDFAAPRTPVEELLAGFWAEVLGVSRVGVDEDFFELGGHSLLSTQLISRVRNAFQVEIPLHELFEHPTVAQFAPSVEAALRAGGGTPVPILPAARGRALPLSFAQQRLWFIDQLEPGSSLYNTPVALRLTGDLNVAALEQTLSEVVRRHEVLRTTFATSGDRPVQVVGEAQPLRLSVADLSEMGVGEREARARELITEEARRPFDLSVGPLLRAGLIKLGGREHVVTLTMHHIVSDGWSLGVLVREVATLYGAYARGQESPLAELAVQYADFAVWQRGWLRGAALGEQLAYWRRQLAGAPESLALPMARPLPPERSFRGDNVGLRLDEELSGQLRALSRRHGATLFMTLLAAWQALLHRYTGQEDIVVGTDVANRNRAETEGLIGFFVNQLVLRTDCSGDPSFLELLSRVRAVALGAYARQDMPFDKLVEALNPNRALSNTPLFQAKLVLQNAPIGELRLPGLAWEGIDGAAGSGTAKFDLLLTMSDGPGGLSGSLEYSTEMFDRADIERLLERFETLLRDAAARPEARLSDLEFLTEDEARERESRRRRRAESNLSRLKNLKPKTVRLAQTDLVKTGSLAGGNGLPLVVEPRQENVDLTEWARDNRGLIEQHLLAHGGVLFRGFDCATRDDFERFLPSVSDELMHYMEGATPRVELGGKIYTSTEYPADQSIALHNELTYVITWPMRIWFCCLKAAEQRGETPIADVRRVYERIDPRVRERFAEKGWMLVRNFGEDLSLPWQSSFHTTDAAEVESYCRRARVACEWKADGGLRTRQVRPAIARHPRTGESVWFNHVAFWHVSSLEPKLREAMLAMFGEDELPYHTYYGDGSRIEDSVVEHIREAYRAARVEFGWQRGDILMLDNMLVAHGRNPFEGARKVIVAMGDGFTLNLD